MLRSVGRFLTSAILLFLSALLMAAGKYLSSLLFPFYRDFSKKILAAIASVTGLLPFALWEALLALGLLLFLYSIFHTIFGKKRFLGWLSGLTLTLSVLIFLFVALWGLNHYAPPLSQELGLQIECYSEQQLTDAARYYLQQANAEAAQVPRDSDGQIVLPEFSQLGAEAGNAFTPLAGTYPIFSGSDAPVKKAALTGRLLSYTGTTGIFIAFTSESTVNPDTDAASLAHTMCHEAAHRCGIAAEDEANFAAYLACQASESALFRYSGAYCAFIYCYNALYKQDPAAARALFQEADALLQADSQRASTHYAQYEGAVQDAAQKANDTYLKAFSEPSGVQSYGEAADYLIAWYLKIST